MKILVVKISSTKLPHHRSDSLEILITSSDFAPSGLAKVSVKLINANPTYMSSHWSSRPRVTVAHHSARFSTTAFKLRTPLPSMCPSCSHWTLPSPTHIIPLMHPALRTTSGNCRVNQACQNCWRNHSEESCLLCRWYCGLFGQINAACPAGPWWLWLNPKLAGLSLLVAVHGVSRSVEPDCYHQLPSLVSLSLKLPPLSFPCPPLLD